MGYILAKSMLRVPEKVEIWHTSKSICAKKIPQNNFFLSIKKSACEPNFIFHRHQQQVFLPIDITFFANIGLEYFSNNILRVFHQSQLELPDLDQNWAKTSPLLLQIFESSNCVDRRIVQSPMLSSSFIDWEQRVHQILKPFEKKENYNYRKNFKAHQNYCSCCNYLLVSGTIGESDTMVWVVLSVAWESPL